MPLWIRDKIYLDFRFKGRRLRPSTGMEPTEANVKLAEQWDAAIQHEIHIGTFCIENHFPYYRPSHQYKEGDGTFKTAATTWLESHKQSWAEWTYRKFKSDLEARIFPKIGRLKVSEITGKNVRLLREAILAEGKFAGGKLTNRSVNRMMQPVKAMLNELFADGDIRQNPVARLGKLKEKRIAEIDPFSDQEIRALLKAMVPWYRPYTEFIFESGFRLNEDNGAKWPNVNFVTSVMSIREGRVLGKDKNLKTEMAIRDVDITLGMMRALKKQKALSYLAQGYIFVTEAGQPLDINNFRTRVWGPALRKAGLKYRYPYQARHTFATRSISQGKDPLWVANQMGTSLEMLFKSYAVYFRKRRELSQCDQSTDLSTPKWTKLDR
jgi:integrase